LFGPGEEHKTAFQTHSDQYEFKIMAFGLCGTPNTFQGAMNSSLAPLLRKCALVFFDDILVYSANLDGHVLHLKQVLQLLARGKWQVKFSKCSFAHRQVDYLGHMVSAQGVATDPKKIVAIENWPVPANVKQLRSFLGFSWLLPQICQALWDNL
jgi:hypothetical protein